MVLYATAEQACFPQNTVSPRGRRRGEDLLQEVIQSQARSGLGLRPDYLLPFNF